MLQLVYSNQYCPDCTQTQLQMHTGSEQHDSARMHHTSHTNANTTLQDTGTGMHWQPGKLQHSQQQHGTASSSSYSNPHKLRAFCSELLLLC
jgi:hypothetical protein